VNVDGLKEPIKGPKRDRNGEVDGKLTFHDDIVFGKDLVDETAAP
jgi:hypothetical protein